MRCQRSCFECEKTGLVVVEKPAGVPVLAGAAPGWQGYGNLAALTSALRRRRAAKDDATGETRRTKRARATGDAGKVWAVNRIDAPVSGIWLAATSPKLAAKANVWMSKTSLGKTYLALVRGAQIECGVRIDSPLAKDKESSLAVVSEKDGKPCATRVVRPAQARERRRRPRSVSSGIARALPPDSRASLIHRAPDRLR